MRDQIMIDWFKKGEIAKNNSVNMTQNNSVNTNKKVNINLNNKNKNKNKKYNNTNIITKIKAEKINLQKSNSLLNKFI